jgi:hypothetical protein
MKTFHVILLLGAALFLLGCSSVSITTDYDREANFAKMKSYDWVTTQKNVVTPDAQAAMFQTSIVEKQMKSAVAAQLEKKGVIQNATTPDFLVAFHMGTQQKVNVTDYGYGYGYGGRWGGGGVDVHQYTQGTLILDFINAADKQLIWRGVASGALADRPDPSTVEEKIRGIVEQMLAEYPPAPAKK